MGVVDLGLAIRQYLGITRVSYEGIRHLASLRNNHAGLTVAPQSKCLGPECSSQTINCNSPGNEEYCSNLQSTVERIRHLLNKDGFRRPEEAQVSLKVQIVDPSTTKKYNQIEATVETPYHGILPFFQGITLTKRMTFSDLYKDE